MPDGKLHIKGTITIKGGKDKKKKKKARKPRQKKDTTGYTGTGTADTRQEFGQPYTATALMTANMIRQQPYQQLPLQHPPLQFEQKTLAPKETYFKLEDIPNMKEEEKLLVSKKELREGVTPYLSLAEQTGFERQRIMGEQEISKLTKTLQDLEAERQQAESDFSYIERQKQAEISGLQQSVKQLESDKQRAEQDFADILEEQQRSRKAFEEEKTRYKQDVGKLQNELVRASVGGVMEGMLQNIETKAQTESMSKDYIMLMQRPALMAELKKIQPKYKAIDSEGKPKGIKTLREDLLALKGYDINVEEKKRGRKKKEAAQEEEQFYEAPSSLEPSPEMQSLDDIIGLMEFTLAKGKPITEGEYAGMTAYEGEYSGKPLLQSEPYQYTREELKQYGATPQDIQSYMEYMQPPQVEESFGPVEQPVPELGRLGGLLGRFF